MQDKKRKMNKPDLPDYSGIFLDSEEIRYEDIDPPLRNLIRFINSQSWIKTYGCCAGHAHHVEAPGNEDKFFIGLYVRSEDTEINRLQLWLDEANRLNGSTGLRTEMEYVHKHPFGQGMVDGWSAYRVTAHEIRKGNTPPPPQIYLRLIKCLETAWEKLWP